ncbi:MAG: TRAP transporter large permease subunit, partial [Gammaproteobacteria bacterium]
SYTRSDNLLPIETVVQLMRECADALHYAHERGITHRDIKPANIMLTQSRHAKLVDFGIAQRIKSDDCTVLVSNGLGTPRYISPEQFRNEQVTGQSDIYSLGVVFYELLTSFFPLALMILAVLGAILFGLATPSEAAGAGALASMVLAAAYRALNFTMLRDSVYLTARATAMVCYLFVGSWTFSAVFAVLGGQQVVENFFLSLNLSQTGFLLLTQAIIFLLGWPLEWTEIIIIFVPIFLPLLDDFGIDPIFFGILVALNTQTAFNTPPVAMAAFYLKGVAPKSVELADIFKGALPFVFMVFATMVLVYVFPQLVLWLPDYLYTPR